MIASTIPVAHQATVQLHSWPLLHLQRYSLDSMTPSQDKVLITKPNHLHKLQHRLQQMTSSSSKVHLKQPGTLYHNKQPQ